MSAAIIQFYVTLRNAVKVYHWNTKSYPRHKATDQFIENIDKLTDSFVEIYIGRYGREAALGKEMVITLPGFTEKSIIKFFEEARVWLSTKVPKLISEKDTDLLNIRDEILGEINQALYLFTLK
jgi:DNA-binding ferritin-like protein